MTKKLIWIGATFVLAVAVGTMVLMLFGFSGGSFSVGENREVVVPRNSQVWLSYDSKDYGGYAAIFIGDVVISGTYYYGYEFEGGERTAFIVPDDASAAVLPYWKRWGLPKRIDLSNADDFAKSALAPDVVAKIAKKHLLTTRGRITIVASNYEVTGECDQPIYLAKFKSVYRPKDMLAAKENTILNCG